MCVHVVVCECDDFLVAFYVLTTDPKANQNPSFTWCSDLRVTANQIILHTFRNQSRGLHIYTISNSESQTPLLKFFLRGGRSVHRLSLSRRSIICLSRLATGKSRYFAQPHPIIGDYFIQNCHDCLHLKFDDKFNWYDGNCNNWQMLKYIWRGSC